MSKDYTQYDWASDRLASERWADEEERMISGIDKRLNNNKKNHRRNKK